MNERENHKKEELQKLAQEAYKILKEELERGDVDVTLAEARAIDARTVGVQGDERTYGYPIEITLYKDDKFIWSGRDELIERLSTRITNEVRGVNRVVYVIGFRK
ncbi:hypothetical protein HYW75_01950 [Candidatus Pacearchaeota archaeon]|nr:hypothetical protein [Candidatus Pacearchaeota archaeon]